MGKRNFGKRVAVLALVGILFGGSLWGDTYTENLGFGFVEKNKIFFDISQKESTAIKTLTYYEQARDANLIIDENINNTINAVKTHDLLIGDVKLSDLLKETESFTKKAEIFEDAFAGMNKVLEKVSVNEDNIQGTIDNLNIAQRIDNLNTYNKNGGTKIELFLNSVKNQADLLWNSTQSAYTIARETFVKIPLAEKLSEIAKSKDQAKNVVFTVQLLEKIYDARKSMNENTSYSDVSETIANIASIASEINSDMGFGGELLANATKLSGLLGDKENLESLSTNNLNSSSKDIISTFKSSTNNEIFLTTMNLAQGILSEMSKSSPYDFAAISNELITLTTRANEKIISNDISNLYTKSQKLNSDFDNIMKDTGSVVSSFYDELGNELQNNPSLGDTLINPNKENLSKLEKTDKDIKNKVKEINDDSQTLAEKEAELEQLKNNSGENQIDQRKMANIQKAQDIVNKNAGKPWSSWSQSDKIAMGIIARNLGVATGQAGIEGKGHFFEALFRFQGTDYLIEKYATSYVPIDYSNLENEINDLMQQINTKKEDLAMLETDKNDAMKSIVDTTSDYNNDIKKGIALDHLNTQEVVYNDWRGYQTKNIRIKSTAGELRFWGGNFDNDVPGGFALERYGKTGNVENVQINDGQSYDILYDEIVKSDYDPDPKNVRIWKIYSNGNNIIVEATGAYGYTSWGHWQQDGGIYTDYNLGHGIEHDIEGHWVAGDVTVDLPKTGSATYTGSVAGSWYTAGDLGNDANRPQYGGAIKGTMSMAVDFSNTAIVAGTLNLKKVDNSSFATANMDNMQMNTTYNAFQGKLIGSNIVDNGTYGNVIKGRFYGPNAEEVGGNWNVKKTTGEFASGVFAGKR